MTGSLRAVETLSRVDPEFSELVDVLYGGALDPVTVWEDAFAKSAPQLTPEQAKARRQKRIQTAGAAIGAASSAYGAYEVGGGVRDAVRAGRKAKGAGKVGRLKALGRPAGRVGIGSVLLAGDVLGTMAMKENASKRDVMPLFREPEEVSKLGLPAPVKRIANGILRRNVERAPTSGVDTAGMPATKTPSQAKGDRKQLGVYRTMGRNAAAGAGAAGVGVAGVSIGGAAERKRSASAYDDDGMSKAAPDVVWAGEFSKFDEDKRLAFGWASVVEKDGLPVVDRQGDYISADDMERAAYVYVQKSRVGGDMHRRDHADRAIHVSDLVESVVFTKEKIAKMGLPASTPIGWWVGFKVHDDATWESVKKGGHTGFSIHGKGRRQETSIDDVMKEHR